MTATLNTLPLFGGTLEHIDLTPAPSQPTLGHVCCACLGTGWVNRGTKRHPLMGYCMCAAGTKAFQDKLEKENPEL